MRRKFEEALPKGTGHNGSKAAEGLAYCNRLFMLEKEMENLAYEERHEKRIKATQPLLDEFWKWVSGANALQGSGLGKAIAYACNQKEALNSFLLDGRIEISNNRAENAIRPFVTGRRNWLFSDTKRGAQASATVYSIIETAKLNGLNPYMYLVHLLTKLPNMEELASDSLEPFMPWSETLPSWCHNAKD